MALQVWLPLDGDLHNQGLSGNLTVTNSGATVDNNGKIGKCYIASGSINYSISCTGTNLSNLFSGTVKYSFSCWVKSVMRSGWIVKLGTSNNIGLWFGLNDSRWVWNDSDNGRRITTVANSEDTTNWHHITVIVDKTTISSIKYKFYFDGQLTVDTTGDGSSKTQPTGDSIIIYPYYGQIQDIRVYDHCLSPKEVEEIAKGLVLHYQLNGIINSNLLPDTNVNGLTKVNGPYNRYYESSGNGTYTITWETINDPPAFGIKYGAHYNVSVVSGSHHVTWYSGGTITVDNSPYTMSCYVKVISGTNLKFGFQYGKSPYVADQQTLLNDNKWHQYSWTFTPNTASGGAAADGTTRIYCGGLQSVGEILICGWKLEKGETATPWCEYGYINNIIYDSSGYSHNGTIIGSLTAAAGSPRYDVATTFPTASDYFYFPHLVDSTAMNNEFTFSCWLYRDYTDATARYLYYGLCQIYLYTDFRPRIQWRHASADLSYDSGNTWAPSPVIAAQTWTHLVFTFKNGVLYCYVDGVQYGPSDRSNTGQFIHGTQGSPNASIGYTWIGKISDVITYATALTAEQVKELYNTSMLVDASGNISPRELGDLI